MSARALVAFILAAGCATPETSSTHDEALTCDLGAPDALAQACSHAGTPTPITAVAVANPSPPSVTADTTAYGVRLVAVGGANEGAVRFTPAQTTQYDIYVGTPNAGFRVLAPGGAAMAPGCTSSITAGECTYLRKVQTFSLVAGQSYKLAFGPTSVSYVRLYVQTRNPGPAVCEAGELTTVEAACSDAAAGDTPVTAATFDANQDALVEQDGVYGVTLPSVGAGSYGGSLAFRPPADGDYELYLGTPNIPLQVTEFFSHVPTTIACTRYLPASECGKLRRGARLTLSAAIPYRIDLGPNAGTSYVRFTIRRAEVASRIKLGPPTEYVTDAAPNSLNHGDLDGDGLVDIIAPIADDAGGTTELELFRNTGGGDFAFANKYQRSVPGQTVVADVTGDGVLDIIGNSWDGMGPIDGYYMVGGGNFTYTSSFWGNARSYLPYIAGADFDEDGVIDVVAPFQDEFTTGPSGFVITLLPSFTVAQTQLAFGNATHQAVAGDFNGDGHQDVVVASTTQAQLFLGDGSGQVTIAGAPFTIASRELHAFDLDGDGLTDLVAVGTTTDVFYGTPTGFTAPVPLATELYFARGAAAGDFDHDGVLDLAIGGKDSETTAGIAVFFGSAAGFGAATVLPVPDTLWAEDLTVADFNGDGFDDLGAVTSQGFAVLLSTP